MITPNPDFETLQRNAEKKKSLKSKIRDSERQESRLMRALYKSTQRFPLDKIDVSIRSLLNRARKTVSDDDFFIPDTGLTAVTFDYTAPARTKATAEFGGMGFGFSLSAKDVSLISTLEQRLEGRLLSIDVSLPNCPTLVFLPHDFSPLLADVVQRQQNRRQWDSDLADVRRDTFSIYQKNRDHFLLLDSHRLPLGDPEELFRDLTFLLQTDYAQNRPTFISHLLRHIFSGYAPPTSSFSRRCCRVFLSLLRGEPFHPASTNKALFDKAILVLAPLLPSEILPPFFQPTSAPERISRVVPRTAHLRVTFTNGDVQRWPLPSSPAFATATATQREYFQIHRGREIVWPELNVTLSLPSATVPSP